MERIKVIKQKLEALKNLDKGYSIFGSSRHHYELNPKLSRDEIDVIQAQHGIEISTEYKLILTELGNGGAGCGYGLERLSLKNINPPYPGTEYLLRNWEDPKKVDIEMVDSDEISGYIKLFDYGCGMETCLIVNGEEKGDLIFFDCDDRFEKLENSSLLDIYDRWLDESLSLLKRVQKKLNEMPLQAVIDDEWNLQNFFIKDMILSLIGAQPLQGSHSGNDKQQHLESEHEQWRKRVKGN